MWQTILKAINVPSPDTNIEEIKELIRQAIRLPDLELQLTKIKGQAANKTRPIEKKLEGNNNKIKSLKLEFKEALKNKDKEEIKTLDQLQGQLDGENISLRRELSKIKKTTESKLKALEKLYKENSKNPFGPIISRRATYSENAVYTKKGIKVEKITPTPSIPLVDSYSILDDGYGNGQFYGKAAPLTLQEAAEHYKKTVVDYDEVNVNRVMPKDKPYDAPYGRRKEEPKSTSPSKLNMDLEEAKDKLNYYENIIEDKRTSEDEEMILRLRSDIKELESQVKESAEESARVEFEAAQQNLAPTKTSLSQIRTILQPITNADFDNFIIALDEFKDSGSSPLIEEYRENNPDEFTDIMALSNSSSQLNNSNDADRYLDKLIMMVNKKSIDFSRTSNNNRVSLQVLDKRYSKETNRLILPMNEELTGKFGEISEWLGRHYEPVPKVENEDLFVKKLIDGIKNVVDEKGGNNSVAYAIQRMLNDNLASLFAQQVVSTGRYLDSNTEQRKFREFINTQSRRDMKLLENIATFLHRGKQMSSFLTENQINKANEMLQRQVGSKAFGRYFLAEIPSAQLTKKPKSNIATRLDSKTPIKTPKTTPAKPMGAKERAENYQSLREQQTYEPVERGLTENQRAVLEDIRQTYRINVAPSAKTIEDNKKKLEQTMAEAEQMSTEEREENLQEWAETLTEIAMKNTGKITYEPYTGRRRSFGIGEMERNEVKDKILDNIKSNNLPFNGFYNTVKADGRVKKADLSELSTKERRKVKTMLQNAHPTEYFGEDYLRLGKVINIIDGLAEDEEAKLLEKLGVKNLQMVKTAASLRKKYENLYKKLYDMVYDEEE